MVDVFAITMALMVGTAGLPHVLIRFYTVKTPAAARWSAMWALVFIALLYLTAPAVGAMARINLIDTFYPNGTTGEAVSLEAIETEEKLEWVRNWEQTGLLKFDDKNGDGNISYVAEAYGQNQKKLSTTC